MKPFQGDQKIEKKLLNFFEKVAKTVAESKNAEISASKLNLKVITTASKQF